MQAQQTLAVDCSANPRPGYLASQLVGVAPGTVIQITGTCLGNVTVTTSNLTFENSGGPDPVQQESVNFAYAAGLEGQIEVAGARNILVNGLTITGTSSDQPGVVYANLWIHDGGSVTLQETTIESAQRDGIRVEGASSLIFQSGGVLGFGIAGVPGANSGISVIDNAAAVIGVPNTNGIAMGTAATYNPDTFGGGFCSCFTLAFPPSWWVQVNSQAGNGITALHGGSVAIYDSIVSVPQVPLAADTGAKIHVEASSFSGGSMQIRGGSSLWLQNSGTSTNGILTSGGSSLVLVGSYIQDNAAAGGAPALQASGNSSITFAGGNSVTAQNGASAVQIDHGSSLIEQTSALYNGADNPDNISGPGLVQEQSTLELGVGPFLGGFGLTWTGNILVEQTSTFRLSGGVSISGAVQLLQGSNGFFNFNNDPAGGTTGPDADYVSGGVSCPFGGAPASHASNPADVTPNPVPIAVSLAGAQSGQCLPF
ncbi:MAG TPA: hypothetical protein VN832_03820 [Stellaceae bacterium]|nr:hypothetical protein [Stellaceae bacterium]